VFSSDVENLDEWKPSGEAYSVVVRLLVGPLGGAGEESFDLTVCSPAWLSQQTELIPVFDGRHHLVVREFNWVAIRAYIEKRVEACVGDTWENVAWQLSRFAYWEFEDHT
jgi:hypothetical protein